MRPAPDLPTTVPGPAAGPAGDVDALAGRFLLLAEQDFAGYCPVYDRLARAIARDPASLEVLLGPAPVNRTPVLALAALHHLVLTDPSSALAGVYRGERRQDPWPLVHTLLHDRTDEVRRLMATRTIQTNEVGRAAALVPALTHVAATLRATGDTRPLAVVELGPSAGLNLLLDRFSIDYVDGHGATWATTGPADSPVRLRCELRGPERPPLPSGALPLVRRLGLDLAPVDVTDADARRWLAACVWPGIPDRPERLAAAVELARLDPPELRRGDASVDLAPLLAELGDDVVPVVVATWALAYLDADGRRAVRETIDGAGAARAIALVTAEVARVTPWVPEVGSDTATGLAGGDDDADGTLTVVGCRLWKDGQVADDALALMHPHARWLGWLRGVGR